MIISWTDNYSSSVTDKMSKHTQNATLSIKSYTFSFGHDKMILEGENIKFGTNNVF